MPQSVFDAGVTAMTADDTSENIERVLGEFELRTTQVELLSSTDHCNAKIVTDSGNYFLKILAPGYPEVQLQSQIKFANFLRIGGLPIPAPLETMAGHRFATTFVAGEARLGVVSPWIDGETLDVHTEANWIERSGELLARLHARSQFFDPPDDFELRAWDEVYAPREEGWLRSFLANSPLDDEAKEIIERAATRTRTLDSRLPKDRRNYWLIHADFHGENQIFDGETIWIVDVEDVGWGPVTRIGDCDMAAGPFPASETSVSYGRNHARITGTRTHLKISRAVPGCNKRMPPIISQSRDTRERCKALDGNDRSSWHEGWSRQMMGGIPGGQRSSRVASLSPAR